MANQGEWSSPTVTSVLTTELNSLGNGTMSTASATISNNNTLDMYADIEVNLASLSPTTGAYVAIYILEAVDASNFPGQSDADLRLTTSQLLCVLPVGTTASTAQRVVARNVLLPPAAFKIKLDNNTGVSLNASGNTVKFSMYHMNLNA